MELLNDTFAVFEDPVCTDLNTAQRKTITDEKVASGLCPYCANFANCNWKMNKKIYCEHYE